MFGRVADPFHAVLIRCSLVCFGKLGRHLLFSHPRYHAASEFQKNPTFINRKKTAGTSAPAVYHWIINLCRIFNSHFLNKVGKHLRIKVIPAPAHSVAVLLRGPAA
jgi:hypothetical protein